MTFNHFHKHLKSAVYEISLQKHSIGFLAMSSLFIKSLIPDFIFNHFHKLPYSEVYLKV